MSVGNGLVIVYTGNGKGKTTAALGMLFRAWGHGRRIVVLQFIKSPDRITGERLAAGRLGIPLAPLGDGFTWLSKDMDRTRELALDAWARGRALIAAGEHDLVILDEFTYALDYGWIETQVVIAALARRPAHVNVVITGRRAPDALIAFADLVTDMREVKHPFKTKKLPAQEGVDF